MQNHYFVYGTEDVFTDDDDTLGPVSACICSYASSGLSACFTSGTGLQKYKWGQAEGKSMLYL